MIRKSGVIGVMGVSLSRFVLSLFVAAGAASALQAQSQADNDRQIDASLQAEIIDSVTAEYNSRYIFADVAAKMEKYVRSKYKKGEYKSLTSLRQFAQQLNQDLLETSRDKHIGVTFLPDKIIKIIQNSPDQRPDEMIAQEKRANFGFQKVEILPGNIGYLDLRGFAEAEFAAPTAIGAMNFLANADAIIFDLRQNGGGSSSMIQLISSYLLAEPTLLNSFYIRETDETKQKWTQAYVQGGRMVDVPVYVLTSDRTFSAAEEFSYNLKNLKRAKIVGDTTRGGAHPVEEKLWASLNVGARIPYGRAINPITGSNWEGTGVFPDLDVPSEQALDYAQIEALKALKEKTDDESRSYTLDWLMTGLNAKVSDIKVDAGKLADCAGKYGPRTIALENGDLFYQREDGPRYRLMPAGDDLFLLDGLDRFRIQFERDPAGRVIKLVGMYDNGSSDSNEREQ